MSEIAHGLLLQEQGRLDEAEACYYGVLSREPENDFVYSRLALCHLSQDKRKSDALKAIDEAIRIRADESFYHALRALILSDLHRAKEAMGSADRAIALNPEDHFALSAKATVYCEMQRWSDAEEWCRRALASNSDDGMAANLLTHVLRVQGKTEMNEAAVAAQLSDDPENSLAHVNAGWSALQKHDHQQAETHFREALRLDPESEAARDGLLESFKARSWFYRAYLSYCFFMQRFTGGKQWAIIIGIYVLYRVAAKALEKISPLIAGGLVCLWLGFVMWVWLAPGIGNFLVFMDKNARLALRKGEVIQGVAVGGGLLAGIMTLVIGSIWESDPAICAGFGLILSTVPASLTFNNGSRKGTLFFGLITAYVYLATIAAAVNEFAFATAPGISDRSVFFAVPAILGAVLCTWLGNIPALRREDAG